MFGRSNINLLRRSYNLLDSFLCPMCQINTVYTSNYSSEPRFKKYPKENNKQGSHANYFVPNQYKPEAEILFGIHPVLSALLSAKRKNYHNLYLRNADVELEETPVNDKLIKIEEIARDRNLKITYVNSKVLTGLAEGRTHQGVCLDVSRFPVKRFYCIKDNIIQRWQQTAKNNRVKFPVWLLAYKVLDPNNLGAILRSAYFLGVDEVIVSCVDSCRMTPTTSKASSGAMEIMSVHSLPPDISHHLSFIQLWKECGGVVIGTESNEVSKSQCVSQFNINTPVLLVIGNEGFGIDDKILDVCDSLFTIYPSCQQYDDLVTSLNVSVALGIILHQLLIKNTKI